VGKTNFKVQNIDFSAERSQKLVSEGQIIVAFDLIIVGGVLLAIESDQGPLIGPVGIQDGPIAASWEGARSWDEPARERIDASGMIMLPGLVNG
jgi:cytosine/adenosine deaminase-related metal-dependent hydrolase